MKHDEMILKFLLVVLIMLLSMFLISVFHIQDIGNYKYFGLIGYGLIGFFFNNEIIKFRGI